MNAYEPPNRKWFRARVALLLDGPVSSGTMNDREIEITVNSIVALADAYAHHRFDDGYEVGYSDGQNACTTDHE